jgi:hypothetical protein
MKLSTQREQHIQGINDGHTNFHKQNSALLGYCYQTSYYEPVSQRLLCVPGVGVLYLRISTSYTKSFVWPQKLKSKGVKSRIGDVIVLEPVTQKCFAIE